MAGTGRCRPLSQSFWSAQRSLRDSKGGALDLSVHGAQIHWVVVAGWKTCPMLGGSRPQLFHVQRAAVVDRPLDQPGHDANLHFDVQRPPLRI